MEKERLTILFIHQVGDRGGASTMLSNIILSLDKSHFSPVVICPSGDAVIQFINAGAQVEIAPRPLYQFRHISGYWSTPWHPRFIIPIIQLWGDRPFWTKYFQNSQASIIFLNAVTLAPMLLSVKKAKKLSICAVQETAVRGIFGFRTAWLRRLLHSHASAVTYISEFDLCAWKAKAPITKVIPNWVNMDIFSRNVALVKARKELNIALDNKVILMMGGISPIKGILPLLRAITLLKDIPHVLLIIAGYSEFACRTFRRRVINLISGDYEKSISRVLADTQVRERIRFLGMVDKVVPLYAAANVVVFPATRPHQARPLLEAGAMAKPVIASNFPNLREYITDNVNGILVRPNDPKALANALRSVLLDYQLANRMGEANYEVAARKNNGLRNASEYSSLFEQLIQNNYCIPPKKY